MAAATSHKYRRYHVPLFSGMLQCLVAVCTFGQTSLTGQVTDATSAPVAFANVYIEHNGVITQLTATTETGRYLLTNIDTGNYKLNVSAIGYKRYDRHIAISKSQTIEINVQLDADTLMLQQVVIQEHRPVSTKGDTIIYDAQYFSTGNEQVLEDLLKNLPGISVLENGKVRFQGKDISKIKIENDDLFNRNYSLLTKNLSADLVEHVEILQNYSDNPLLKGIENTDDVAINLTLKEDRKKALFGDARLATNFKDRHDTRINLVSLMEKLKIYGLSNFNNLGEDPTGDVEDLVNPNRIAGNTVGDGVASEDIVNILRPSIPEFKRERYIFNKAQFGAVSGIFKPLPSTSIHVTGYAYGDNQPFHQTTSTQYYTPADTVTFHETTDSKIRESVKYVRASLTQTINKSTNLAYKYLYNAAHTDENQFHVFNFQDISRTLNTRSELQDHHVNLTKRIQDKSALTVDLRYLNDSRPQNMFIDGNVLDSFFNTAPPSDTLLQNTSFHTTFVGTEANFFTNFKNGKLGLRTGIIRTEQATSSALNVGTAAVSDNSLARKQNQYYTEAYYTRRLKNLTVTPALSLEQINVALSDRKNANYFFVNPKLSLKWSSGQTTASILASVNNSLPATSQLIKTPVVTGYNAIAINDSSFRSFTHQTLLATYTYGGWGKGFSINASCFYQKAPNAYLINSDIEASYLVSIRNRVAARDMTSFSVTADKYFSKISSNIKLSVLRSHASFVSLIEDVATSTTSASNRIEFSFRTAFTGNFNFHVGHVLNTASSRSRFIDAINLASQSYLDLYLKALDKKLNGTLHLERFDLISVESRPVFYFLDINLKYQIPKSRFGFFIKGKNLLNENRYRQRTVSYLNTAVTSNNLIPRYVLLGLNVRL